MQIPSPDVAELLASGGFDWVTIDLEHGAIARHQLPDLFRAIELHGAVPLARVALPDGSLCQQALDSGAVGVVIPRVESASQLTEIVAGCMWPPSGKRGVGFSRANLFGRMFEDYKTEAQQPLIVAQIESKNAVTSIASLLAVRGLDAVMIGPYDLSASLGVPGQVDHPDVRACVSEVLKACRKAGVPSGMHVVTPDPKRLEEEIAAGHRFLAYGVDAVFVSHTAQNPRGRR
ncbi:MAG: 2,4-dihydroxyhept-2-ene-1,7-dioic acid aldolase [Acidimicrobiia bacterium]|nr:2,4-dihydroxyhept-2-ene-1,7-dioic acid aldolase [Acidimicrobiia bacterium]